MDRESLDSIRSPMRPWAQILQSQQLQQQQIQPSPTLANSSPKTPQSAYSARSLLTPIPHSAMYKTPTTPLPPSSSLAALDAKSISRDFGQPRLDLTAEDKWRRLGARVLPLFNGDRLQGTVEENNEIVRSCLRSDLDSVWHEIHNILRVGMSSLIRNLYRQYGLVPKFEAMANHGASFGSGNSGANVGSNGKQLHLAMLSMNGIVNAESVGSEQVVEGLVNVWEMLFSHILPYIEGVFLPLLQFKVATVSNLDKATNIRQAVLSHFRDSIVVPLLGRLDDAAGMIRAQGAQGALGSQSVAILLQMLTILASLTPTERGPVYNAARTFAMALSA